MKKIFFVLLLSCGLAPSASADDRVRITYASRSISSVLAFIATDRGFFKEENLEPAAHPNPRNHRHRRSRNG